MSTSINRESLRELRSLADGNDAEFLQSLVETFIESAERYLYAIRVYQQGRNSQELTKSAHALKSSCGNLGATRMYEICRSLEKAGREYQWKGTDILIHKLEEEYERVKEELEEEVFQLQDY